MLHRHSKLQPGGPGGRREKNKAEELILDADRPTYDLEYVILFV